MLEKKFYVNGQPIYQMSGDKLIYYYKNGKIKAEGQFINNLMEGEWIFYRETGQLWQIANFKNSKKTEDGFAMIKMIKLNTRKLLGKH